MKESIETFLDRLAARGAAPAGGASAALQAAQGAALVAMVARHVGATTLVDRLDRCRRRALELMSEDVAAYAAVLAAAPAERSAALREASRPQAEVCLLGASVIEIADEVAGQVGARLAPDLAAGVLSAAAAVRIAGVNVAANLHGSSGPATDGFGRDVDTATVAIERAEDLVARLTAR